MIRSSSIILEAQCSGAGRRRRRRRWPRPCASRAHRRRASSRSTRRNRPNGRCSILATHSAMRWSGRTNTGLTLLHGEGVGRRHGDGVALFGEARACAREQDAVRAERLLNALGLATRVQDLRRRAPIAPKSCWRTWPTTRRPATAAADPHSEPAASARAYIQRDADPTLCGNSLISWKQSLPELGNPARP